MDGAESGEGVELLGGGSAVAWRHLIGYGVGFGIVQFACMFTAFRLGIPAGLAGVLLQTQALFTIGLAYLMLGERATRGQTAGIGIAAAGVAVIIAGEARGAALLPAALVLTGGLGWGLANIVLKRARPLNLLAFTVWTGLVPPLPMFALSLATEGPSAWGDAWVQLTWIGAAAVLWLAYPISLASGVAWTSLMSRYSAATIAPFALLVPVIAMASGALIYGERLTPSGLAGSLLVLAGLVVLMAAGRRVAGRA